MALLISSFESFSLQHTTDESMKNTYHNLSSVSCVCNDAEVNPPREEDVAVLSSTAVDD